jgi:inosose dehydratase
MTTTKTRIQLANAPCSWGVLEFDLGGAAGYERVLDEMAQAGYVGTELGDWGFMPTDPERLAAELQKRRLSLLAAFVPVELANAGALEEGVKVAVKTARLLKSVAGSSGEAPYIVLADDNGTVPLRTKKAGRITAGDGLSAAEWKQFGAHADTLARRVLYETGVRTVFHHHAAGFVETPDELDAFLSNTNPELIGLCLDTGHYSFGGGDPLQAIAKYGKRIWHVHFKDCDAAVHAQSKENEWDYFESVKRGIFCELGKGQVQFSAVLEKLKALDYTGWIVVEQDVLPGMGSPLESATRNREFLSGIGL